MTTMTLVELERQEQADARKTILEMIAQGKGKELDLQLTRLAGMTAIEVDDLRAKHEKEPEQVKKARSKDACVKGVETSQQSLADLEIKIKEFNKAAEAEKKKLKAESSTAMVRLSEANQATEWLEKNCQDPEYVGLKQQFSDLQQQHLAAIARVKSLTRRLSELDSMLSRSAVQDPHAPAMRKEQSEVSTLLRIAEVNLDVVELRLSVANHLPSDYLAGRPLAKVPTEKEAKHCILADALKSQSDNLGEMQSMLKLRTAQLNEAGNDLKQSGILRSEITSLNRKISERTEYVQWCRDELSKLPGVAEQDAPTRKTAKVMPTKSTEDIEL